MCTLMRELEGSARVMKSHFVNRHSACYSLSAFGVRQNQYLLPLFPSKSVLIGTFFLNSTAVLSRSASVLWTSVLCPQN